MTSMEDEKILELYWQREEEALVQTKKKYGALCRSVAEKILPDERDTEECVSDTWLKLWNSIPPQWPASLKGYAARIARNLALDRYNYNHAAQRSTALTEAFEELEAVLPLAGPGVQADPDGFPAFLKEFLQGLSSESRIYFVRRYWYGESIKEIAAACGAGESGVKSSLMRTRNRMREAMEREGVTL